MHHVLKYQVEQEDQELEYEDQAGEDQWDQDNQSHMDQWDQNRTKMTCPSTRRPNKDDQYQWTRYQVDHEDSDKCKKNQEPERLGVPELGEPEENGRTQHTTRVRISSTRIKRPIKG